VLLQCCFVFDRPPPLPARAARARARRLPRSQRPAFRMVRSLVLRLLPRPALPVVETVLPLRQLPSNQQVFGLAPWLGVVGLGAVWMVQVRTQSEGRRALWTVASSDPLSADARRHSAQPFDWIQKQLSSPPPEK
jgi:hypothetical protein